MLNVLRDRIGCESFIQHCLRELCVENILFLVEIAQYNVPDYNNYNNINNNDNNNEIIKVKHCY